MPATASAQPTTTPADTADRYRTLRRDGLGATHAYRAATDVSTVRYRSGPGDAITLLPDDRPDLAGFTVTAVAEPDDSPDLVRFGEFSDRPVPGAVPLYRAGRHVYEYFLPDYTVAQRRADLSRMGYARGPAHEIALRQAREDAETARRLEGRTVRVEVRKAGLLLGEASLGTTCTSDEPEDVVMAEVIHYYRLLDEAAEQARAALLPLIAALAA